MRVIKVGIIGTGFSATAHIEGLRRLPNVEVVAVYSRKLEKAEALAKQYGIKKAYDNVDDLINDNDVEVVHNCTVNRLHYPINKKVLLAGKHLLSEKPLALNSDESKELQELAAKSQAVSGVCFNYRHFPMVKHIKDEVASGQHGSVHLVTGGYIQDWCLYDTDYSWRMDSELNGASRAIADIGSHWCDTLQYVLGQKITKVFADLQTIYPTRKKPTAEVQSFSTGHNSETEEVVIDTEDCGSVLVHFEGGARGVFSVSQVSAGRKNHLHFELAAKESTIAWDLEKPNKAWIGKRNEANRELFRDPGLISEGAAQLTQYPGGHQEGWPDALKNLFVDFYRKIEDKESQSSFATVEDGHRIMRIVDAILESSATGQWVKLS